MVPNQPNHRAVNADMVAEEELQEKGLPERVVVEAEDVWHGLNLQR
jgi:hypothetical protein